MLNVEVEPVRPVSRGWVGRFTLIWFGVWAATLVPVQLTLPEQLDAVDHAHHIRDFGILNGLVGLFAVATLPLFGALCDRTRTPFGRRRVWVLGGVLIFALGLVLTGLQTHVAPLMACWVLATLGGNMIAAGLTAVVADDVPDAQRGLISGAIYGPQAVGVVVGLVAVGSLATAGRYVVLAAALLVFSVPFLVWQRDSPTRADHPPLSLGAVIESLYISPSDNPDFVWAWWGRLAVNFGNAFCTSYLLYFLRDDLKVPHPEDSLLTLTLVYLVCTLIATYVGGVLSDRTGRRRIFVGQAAGLQAVAALLLYVHPSLATGTVAAGMFGAAYGCYMSVDQALVTAVLPDAEDRAKDLGIMNIGSVGPQAFGPLIASGIIVFSGYDVLFLSAGLVTTAGAVMVYRIRSVR